MKKLRTFVSSVQKELAEERRAVKDFILHDPLLSRFTDDVFLFEDLPEREPHGPMPRNPLIAEPLFRVQYVEKAGTGTTDMIADCRAAGLPEPEFRQCGPHFVTTIWRDWFTADVLAGLGLSERQMKGMDIVKTEGVITTLQYQSLLECSRRTAARDLDDLLNKGILNREGAGRATCYVLVVNRAKNVPNVPSEKRY